MECDVLVVGGGPAGSCAAFFLADTMNVYVVERLKDERFDRYHSICGEGISEDAFYDIRPIEPWGIKNRIDKMKLVWPCDTEVDVPLKGYIIDRPTFLRELKGRCVSKGVTFLNGSVKHVEEQNGRYVAQIRNGGTISCKYLIGADGAFSVVRKDIFRSRPAEIHPVKHYVTSENTKEFIVRLDERYEGSYRWRFPSGDLSTEGFASGYDSIDDAISEKARFIPYGGVEDIVKGNAVLIGDAAAMANPVSFGGLKAALISGKKAANAISKKDPKAYARWWKMSILSSKRFMRFHKNLKKWSNDDMIKAVRPFRHGHVVLSALWACLTRPWNIGMYIGCLFAFKFSW